MVDVVTKDAEDVRPARVCSCCRTEQHVQGGRWAALYGGLLSGWVCARCLKIQGDYNECD